MKWNVQPAPEARGLELRRGACFFTAWQLMWGWTRLLRKGSRGTEQMAQNWSLKTQHCPGRSQEETAAIGGGAMQQFLRTPGRKGFWGRKRGVNIFKSCWENGNGIWWVDFKCIVAMESLGQDSGNKRLKESSGKKIEAEGGAASYRNRAVKERKKVNCLWGRRGSEKNCLVSTFYSIRKISMCDARREQKKVGNTEKEVREEAGSIYFSSFQFLLAIELFLQTNLTGKPNL